MTPRRKVMAIDPGTKRVGLAISDSAGKVALPLEVVSADTSVDRIGELVAEHGVTEVIVGLPRTLEGSEGPAAEEARRLSEVLKDSLGVPVALIDERMTTVAATRALREANVSSRRGRTVVDKIAATLLLQSYLDSLKRNGDLQ